MTKNLRSFIIFLLGTTIFAGIPLLAWGLGGLGGFFNHPARLFYISFIIILQAYLAILIPNAMNNAGKGKQKLNRHIISLQITKFLSLAIVILAPYSDSHTFALFNEINSLRYLGLFLSLVGFFLMNLSLKHLGKQFSVDVTVQKNHKLITTGVYQFVRHPRYLGIIQFFLGYSLLFLSWLSVLLVICISCLLVWRLLDEEVLLAKEFGKKWSKYCKNSWKLVPHIY